MEIINYLHTAILISDVAQSEKFYSEVLGLTKVERNLKYPGIWYQVGNYQIHLMEHPDFKQPLSNPEKVGRNPHIAFAVKDLNQAIERLKAFDYPLEISTSRPALFTRDPDGNVIEINQA
ncbi:MAG: VOC family protein [Snowella sp.]|nr:VOC family protein [Snowella sp.]